MYIFEVSYYYKKEANCYGVLKEWRDSLVTLS